MRSSYKTTVKPLLKSGEVFALFLFYNLERCLCCFFLTIFVSFLWSLHENPAGHPPPGPAGREELQRAGKSGGDACIPALLKAQYCGGIHSLGLCSRFYRHMAWTILWWKTY